MTSLPPPSHIKPGDHIRVHEDPALGQQADWRVMGHKGLWEVSGFKTDQRGDETQPTLYIQLKSVEREGGVAFTTIPYSNKTIELIETQPEPKEPIFPEKGSQVVIREGGVKDGLWEIQQAKMEMLANGKEQLKMTLKSVDRKNLSFLNIAFNAVTMQSVMPVGYEAHKPDVAMKRVTNVFKPISFRK